MFLLKNILKKGNKFKLLCFSFMARHNINKFLFQLLNKKGNDVDIRKNSKIYNFN